MASKSPQNPKTPKPHPLKVIVKFLIHNFILIVMVSTAQLYPEELPDRDKSYDTAEPDLSYYYKVPRRFHSHERT